MTDISKNKTVPQCVQTGVSDSALDAMINRLPFVFDWVTYKGIDVVAQINLEATRKAKKPMFDLSYCMTKAFNQVIDNTVQFDKSKFKKSSLSDAVW